MTERRLLDCLVAALTFVFILFSVKTVDLFLVGSEELASVADGEELIVNYNFTVSSFGIFGRVPGGWSTDGFDYEENPSCIRAEKAGAVATAESVFLSGGLYVMTAEAEALNGEAIITLFLKSDSVAEENTFSITGRRIVRFYLLENEISVNAGVKITSITGESVKIYSVSLKKADESSAITTEKGASIRTETSDPGLRFKGRVNKTVYDALKTRYDEDNLEVGMLFVPVDFLRDGTDFTADGLKEKTHLTIAAKKFNNVSRAEEDGYYGFNCAITEIAAENTDRKFAARAYIKCVDGETEKYVYAPYEEENHCRSVYEVASAAKTDENGDYADNAGVKTVIDEYLSKVRYLEIKGEDFTQRGTEFYKDSGVFKGVLFIVSGYSEEGYFKITENGKEITPVNGYYLAGGTGNLKIAFVFYSAGLHFMQDVSVKFYKYD